MDGGLRAGAVESRPVCYADIRLGVVVDVLLDDELQRVRGFPARRRGRPLGTVVDLVFAPNGELVELVVETEEGQAAADAGPGLVVGPDALRPAV